MAWPTPCFVIRGPVVRLTNLVALLALMGWAVLSSVQRRERGRLMPLEARLAFGARGAPLSGPRTVRTLQERAGLTEGCTVQELEDTAEWCGRM